ncbi:hypothetical protein VZT92_012179 [Zoarces viviparus]|uniref:Uncharacterized protein n=1 Tax=Zoarces viviparus TaxID=48416 RepID=A0AAW1F6Y1_ZOAVI
MLESTERATHPNSACLNSSPPLGKSLSVTLASLHPQTGQQLSPGTMEVSGAPGLVPSPQSEAVTTELQELSLQPGPVPARPLQERKNGCVL